MLFDKLLLAGNPQVSYESVPEIYSSISLVLGCVKLSNTALQHFHDLLLPAYIFETSFSTFVTWFSKKLRMDQSKLGIPCAAIYC